jgi:AcrR family transcriptional regulator
MASGDLKRMLPLVARAFADLGYRRATTAALAKRCGVRENVLYRAWPDKKAMFIASIEFVWQRSVDIWQRLVQESGKSGAEAAKLILEYESKHHGETGLYKVVFAGLTELDDPQVAAALRNMYRSFHAFITRQVNALREQTPGGDSGSEASDEMRAWGVLGIATVANIDRELKLFSPRERAQLFTRLLQLLIQ